MTATAHALVGGAIAAAIPNPAIAIPLALASHPVLDMIPHWDFGWGWRNKSRALFLAEGIFDLTIGLVSSYLIFGAHTNLFYLLTVIFASLMFDLLMVPYWFFNWRFPPFSWAYLVQSHINSKAKLPWGIFTQAITVMGVILVLRGLN